MHMTLSHVLENPIFKEASILAGSKGLSRTIKRVSVFDCPFSSNENYKALIQDGDFFISCLEQFRTNPQTVMTFLQQLIDCGSSGLCIVTNVAKKLLTLEEKQLCEAHGFPVIAFTNNIPYATLLEELNKQIIYDQLHIINHYRLERLLGRAPSRDKLTLLSTLCPHLKPYVCALLFTYLPDSMISLTHFKQSFIQSESDFLLEGEHYYLLLMSHQEAKPLELRQQLVKQYISENLSNLHFGLSQIYEIRQINQIFQEAQNALTLSKLLGKPYIHYTALSPLPLLVNLKDSQELRSFYNAFIETLSAKVSENNLLDLLETLEIYVQMGGDYKKSAERICQHENTVRYRINKIKNYLNLDDDIIQFHQIIALAMQAKQLLNDCQK